MKKILIIFILTLCLPTLMQATEVDPPKGTIDKNAISGPLRVILEIPDIQGEFNPNTAALNNITDNSILLEDYSYSEIRSVSDAYLGSGSRDLSKMLEPSMTITFSIDKATTVLYNRLMTGTIIPQVFIKTFLQGANPNAQYETLQTIELKNVIIESIQVFGANNGEGHFHDAELKYEAIKKTFMILDPNTGNNQGNVPMQWNYRTQTATF